MLRSMTGYGASSREEANFRVSAELRSVNHRHLNAKLRLDRDLAALEPEIEALVKKRLARGSVSVFISCEGAKEDRLASVDAVAAARYRGDIEAVAKELGIAPEVSMDTLLTLPGVVASADNGRPEEKRLRKCVLATVDEALDRLVEMREVEGAAIGADLAKHAAATKAIVAKVERRMPTVVKTHQKNLEKRVGELLGDRQAVQSADVAREVALLADRLDVSEEIARLVSHLDQLDSFLAKGGLLGRKLDFLVQEIFREVNTIGSKCSDAKVAHWVVDAKTHVERLREQVQNVE